MVVVCGGDAGLLGLSFETLWLDYEAFSGGYLYRQSNFTSRVSLRIGTFRHRISLILLKHLKCNRNLKRVV
jgi:hypothetical protein